MRFTFLPAIATILLLFQASSATAQNPCPEAVAVLAGPSVTLDTLEVVNGKVEATGKYDVAGKTLFKISLEIKAKDKWVPAPGGKLAAFPVNKPGTWEMKGDNAVTLPAGKYTIRAVMEYVDGTTNKRVQSDPKDVTVP